MMGYIEALDKLGCELKNDLATDVILQSIPVSYELFIMNFHMKRDGSNDLNTTFIWHCRLGHINYKRIERLHKDGLPSSFDFESFDTCESCLFGKMTETPFTGQSEKASDLYILMYVDQ
jgi:hypothetical protein